MRLLISMNRRTWQGRFIKIDRRKAADFNEFAVYLFFTIPWGYLPCAKLFMVLDESFILISSDCVSFFWLAGQFLFYTIGVFFSRLIGKPLSYPATIAGFLLYKKSRSLFNDLLHIFYLFSNKINMSQSFLDCRYHPLGRMRSRMF